MNRTPTIGSKISLPTGGDALLKYVGSISGKEGVFCGLELLGDLQCKGKNSGEVNGERYFQVETPNSGLFVPLRKFQSWFPNNESSQRDPSMDVYQQRIMKSELDLKEMSIQLDEVEHNMRLQEEEWGKREAKFAVFKSEKELEINQLMETINVLNEKVSESERKFSELTQKPSSVEDTVLQEALERERREFRDYKVKMNKQVDDLRSVEMDNYKLQLKLEEKEVEIADLKSKQNLSASLIDENGSLKVFQRFDGGIDPTAGEANFCDFCDKHGHSRSECPYENDDMEQF